MARRVRSVWEIERSYMIQTVEGDAWPESIYVTSKDIYNT